MYDKEEEEEEERKIIWLNKTIKNIFHFIALLVLFYSVKNGIDTLDEKGWIFPILASRNPQFEHLNPYTYFFVKNIMLFFGLFYMTIIYAICYDRLKSIFLKNTKNFNNPTKVIFLTRIFLALGTSMSVSMLFYPIGFILLLCFFICLLLLFIFAFLAIFRPLLTPLLKH